MADRTVVFDRAMLVLAMVAAGAAALFLGRDTSWDLRNYHYYNGYALLNGRLDYDIAPAQIQSYLNPLADVAVYLGMRYLPARLFGFALGALQGIGIWLVYRLARLATGRYPAGRSIMTSVLAATTAFTGAGWLSEVGGTMGDSIVAIFVLAALLMMVSAPAPIGLSNGKRPLIGAGLLLGFCTGLKLVAAVYVAGFLTSLLFLLEKRQLFRLYLLFGASLAVGAALSIGFWMEKLWAKFHSPLFPFYNKIFRSEHFAYINFGDSRFLPRTAMEKLFYPFFMVPEPKLVSEVPFRDLRLSALYLAVMLLAVRCVTGVLRFRREGTAEQADRQGKLFFLVSFSVISYLGWQTMFSIYRYLIPLELLTPVVVVAVCGATLTGSKLPCWLSSGVLALLIATTLPMNWGRLPWGSEPPAESEYLSYTATAPLAKFAHSTVLMAGGQPTSYVIPFFPPGTSFVRIESNFLQPGHNTLFQGEIDRAIRGSKSLKMLLTDPCEVEAARTNKVSVDLDSCDSIDTSFRDHFLLCDALAQR